MDPLSGPASVIAVIQLTGSIVQICGKYLSNVKNATQDIQRFQEKIAALAQVLQSLDELINGSSGNKLTATQDLLDNITKCSKALEKLKEKIDPETTLRGMRKWGLRAFKWPLARSEVDRAIMEVECYRTTFVLSLEIDQTRSTNSIHKKIDLGRLQTAKGAAFDSYDNQHSECLPGTRIDLLREIGEWTKSPYGKCIFWLNGMAGTGKSTISRTIARHLKEEQLLGASFFFKRGEADRGTAKRLFPTLIEQLIIDIPQMLPRVQKAINDDPNISEKVLREQFEKLLLDPLLGIEQCKGTTIRVIVIDALDECDLEDDIAVILRLLPQVQKSTSVQLRFLLTSRPELPIRLGFERIADAYQDLVLHEIDKAVIEHDISLYIEDKFLRLKQMRSFPLDWPGDAATKKLVDRAVPLFIAAATLCLFIGDAKWNPQKRLEAILTDQLTYASKMDSTYIPVLKQLLTGQDETESRQLLKEFKEIVGVIIILATPLSINSLSQIVNREPEDVKCRLDQLHSVLSVPNDFDTPVRLLHLSFRDFLLDHHEHKSRFWIDGKYANQLLTAQCLRIMQRSLRKNICRLPSEGTRCTEISQESIQQYITPELRYACRYWVHHLVQCTGLTRRMRDVFLFLKTYFLHWVEAMGLLGVSSEILGILGHLKTVISDDSSLILNFLHDAKRFILKNRQVLSHTPLQIYCAGLVFAPQTSIIRGEFKQELPNWICQFPRVEEKWGSELQTLEGHSSWVNSVAFSPNDQLLASGSTDQTVRIWDRNTGVGLQTLTGHSSSVMSVNFSLDSRLLASSSTDKTIRIWDTHTGDQQQAIEGHLELSQFMAFSSNDQSLLICPTHDISCICGTDAVNLYQTLKGSPGLGQSITFSPDNQLVAFSSDDAKIWLWNLATDTLKKKLKGHSRSVRSVKFSPDSRLLASSSTDTTVRIWDAHTGTLQQVLRGHSEPVTSVAFSSDSRLLVSGSYDKTIRIWDIAEGALAQNFSVHTDSVESVTFSPNGRLLASSSGGNVQLWDTASGSRSKILKGHPDSVWSEIAFSPDSRFLAVGSDKTVRLLNVATGNRQTLKGHSDVVQSLAFAPNGQIVASGSDDQTVRLWDTARGSLLHTIRGFYGSVRLLVFSPDAWLLAVISDDEGIWLCNWSTGDRQHIFEENFSPFQCATFSHDGKLLACSSEDGVLWLWNLTTRSLQQTFKGHLGSVESVAFSPDSRSIASSACDNTVRLWDVVSGGTRQIFEVKRMVTELCFSADSSWLTTDLGYLRIQNSGGVVFADPTRSKATRFLLEDEWVILERGRALWLPSDFRPRCSAVRDNALALGHSSGRVSLIKFCN